MTNSTKKSTIKSFILELLIVVSIVFTLDTIFIIRYDFHVSFNHWVIAFFNVMLAVAIIAFVKNPKKRYLMYLLFIAIMATFFVTDSVLYFFKKDVTSVAMLLESFKNTMKIGLKYDPRFAYSIFQWLMILAFVVLMAVFLRWVIKKNNQTTNQVKSRLSYLIIALLGVIFAPTIVNETDKLLFNTPADKALFVQKFGSITYHAKDIVMYTTNAIKPLIFKDDYLLDINDQVSDEFSTPSDYYGIAEGKNVIMIMCETCEEYAFTPEYTPNYYRLRDQSVYFTNFFSAAKLNYTYDAEFKSLTSLMYYQSDNYMYSRANNAYPTSIPSMLKEVGYTAHSFHNYFEEFFNRDKMHLSLGFESFYAFEGLGIEESDSWPLDTVLFETYKDRIVPVQENPFYSFIITVTPHGPHNEYRESLKKYYDILDNDPLYENESIEYKTITAAQMNFDEGLGILLDDLEQKDLLDDTVILMYSDHKNYSSQDLTILKTPNADIPYEIEKVPFLMYVPGLEVGENILLSSHYDIAPTLLDLLGISAYKDLYYGQSIFASDRDDRPIILTYSNWISPSYRVELGKVVYGDADEEEIFKQKESIYQTIQLHEKIFFSDYFRTPNPFYTLETMVDEIE